VLETIVRCGVTTLCAPPTVWRMLVGEDLGAYRVALREVVGAGEPLNPEVIAQVQGAWGLTIRDGYGQTETSAQFGNSPGQPIKAGSVGRPLPGFRVQLLDSNGAARDEGEICLSHEVRPTGLMEGYQLEDGKLQRLSEIVYRTGDIARRDTDGYMTFVGRADDVFKASDYRISPFELESALIEHPAIAEAAVVPSPDPRRMAVPKAFIALAPGQSPDRATALSIFQHVRRVLAPFKRVRRLEFAELPKTISGKIRRVELRAAEIALRAAGTRLPHEYWEDDFPELAASDAKDSTPKP
jgi:acetyl-CoA synthetase